MPLYSVSRHGASGCTAGHGDVEGHLFLRVDADPREPRGAGRGERDPGPQVCFDAVDGAAIDSCQKKLV